MSQTRVDAQKDRVLEPCQAVHICRHNETRDAQQAGPGQAMPVGHLVSTARQQWKGQGKFARRKRF